MVCIHQGGQVRERRGSVIRTTLLVVTWGVFCRLLIGLVSHNHNSNHQQKLVVKQQNPVSDQISCTVAQIYQYTQIQLLSCFSSTLSLCAHCSPIGKPSLILEELWIKIMDVDTTILACYTTTSWRGTQAFCKKAVAFCNSWWSMATFEKVVISAFLMFLNLEKSNVTVDGAESSSVFNQYQFQSKPCDLLVY